MLAIGRMCALSDNLHGKLERVEMTAALGSGSAPRPSLPQPRPRAAHLILGSGPSRLEATSQPSKGPPKTEALRLNPLAGKLAQPALLAETVKTIANAASPELLKASLYLLQSSVQTSAEAARLAVDAGALPG
jgi:hypothetical protein